MSEACPDRTVTGDVSERPGPRELADDFYCLRFQVHYPSIDCAIRTKYRTCAGCLDCDQGRFNFARHERALRGVRFKPFPVE